MAMLLITHDLGIVRQVADHVCVMKHGEIVESGEHQPEILRHPQHEYTKHAAGRRAKGRAAQG
jgi:microcin C transport system ATP-binding protein